MVYSSADITGPPSQPDCRLVIFDFALFAENWLH